MSALLALAVQAASQPRSPTRRRISQTRLNAMADACHAPRNWVELRGREVVFKANPDSDLTKIECVLGKISAVVDMTNIGLVGNEQAPKDK
ncbi:hypothetical protein FHT00_001893 [Sphingomonas insulae]|uniref:BON domain-containing protein n=1 Tax=Sphingomonas insulae TaxID=424800 RepID=A0ABP3T000_9SPHN|nr:hypothetical protein [Sphingomonas insulae]NIJ29946.1 hypothetical protein [Sphingomonas insulae]